jgi:hypothetical protein
MNAGSHTLSEILGKYHQQNYNQEDGLPYLHNLTYLSKDWYQGDTDRYAREECNQPISDSEFIKYFNKEDIVHAVVFKISRSLDYFNITILERKNANTVSENINMTIYSEAHGMRPRRVFDKANLSVNLFSDTIPNEDIIFDIVTMYNILTKRGKCISIIKNYAKKIISNTFEDIINKLFEKNISYNIVMLNMYLYGNAFMLGISGEYAYLGEPGNLYQDFYRSGILDFHGYTINTQPQRNKLINVIREYINKM